MQKFAVYTLQTFQIVKVYPMLNVVLTLQGIVLNYRARKTYFVDIILIFIQNNITKNVLF